MKELFLVIVLLFAPLLLKAQYDAQFSNYWAAGSYFNPAVAGHTSTIDATAIYRQQWLSINGAPQTFLVTGNMPMKFLERTHGVGIVAFNESIGLFKRNIISGQYSYKKKLWGGYLGVGLQAGMINETFDGTKAKTAESNAHESPENDDAIATTEATGSVIDLGFGIYYSHEKWHVGLSSLHLTEPQIEMGENAYMYPARTYYLTGGYNIELNNPLLELQPSVFAKSTIQMNTVDVNLRLCYNKMLLAGLGWRSSNELMVTLGAKFGKIQAGYAYDFPLGFLRKGTSGSHELFLKYSMELTPGKGNKNKYKSVRIL